MSERAFPAIDRNPGIPGIASSLAFLATTISGRVAPRIRHALRIVLAALLLGVCIQAGAAALPEVTLGFGAHKLTAEVASTDATRSTGLMHRRMMPESRGMLFIFPNVALHGMWMMNTYLPLSVAFIDSAGVITNIADMEPHTQTSHMATRPVKYALEMNQGWFRKRGIKAGDKVDGLESAGAAR